MEHFQGYAWGIAVPVAMFSRMAAMFAVHAGLVVGVFLSFLAFFVQSLRRIVPYLSLMPLCAAVAGWGALLGFCHVAGLHLDMDQVLRAMFIGPFASFTLGSLAGAGLGYSLAKFLSRFLARPTIPLTPPQSAPAAR